MCLLLHSADVSHPTKTWELHKEWTARCMEEFFNQGDREKEMGLDVSPLCDRNTTQVPQSQIGFIDFILIPQFSALNDVINFILGTYYHILSISYALILLGRKRGSVRKYILVANFRQEQGNMERQGERNVANLVKNNI